MKIVWLLVILSVLVISCGNDQQKTDKTETTSEKATHDHAAATEGLELNNGVKWKADASTNKNVADLRLIVEKFSTSADKSISGYTSAGADLQVGLNKLIAECKMKGPDHDALHKWLEPLIGDVAKLKKSTSKTEAGELITEIDKRLTMYSQYFE